MRLKQISEYSDKLLKGKHTKSLLVCLMYLGTWLFFKLAEATVFSIILYIGASSPVGLFTGENPIQVAVTLLCTLLRYITTAPLAVAAAYWFIELCSESKKIRRISLSRILLDPNIWGKSLAATLLSKLIGAVFLIPALFFGRAAFSFFIGSSLFMAVHAAVMTLLSAALWIWAKTAMITVPYLMVKDPESGVIKLLRQSFKLMKGRRIIIIRIIIRYAVTLRLPKLFTTSALFISISLKEDEYLERNKLQSDVGQAPRSSKLPWSKRRITPASDKAQTAGYGDNP